MSYRGVIFDYVGVLVEMNREQAATFFKQRAPLPVSALTRRWEEWCSEHIGEVLSGHRMWQTFWDAMSVELSIEAGVLREIHAFDYFGMFRACPDAVTALAEARRLGMKIGVLSNSVLPKIESDSMPLDLNKLADVVQVPRKGSAKKPDAEAYLEVATLLGVPAGECLYFDNERGFVDAACRAGMRGYLVDRSGGPDLAAGVVKDLSGLAALAEGSPVLAGAE